MPPVSNRTGQSGKSVPLAQRAECEKLPPSSHTRLFVKGTNRPANSTLHVTWLWIDVWLEIGGAGLMFGGGPGGGRETVGGLGSGW
jgi:hypothetical protein